MKITQLSISNFRSFEQTPELNFGQLNVLVGKNNAGKSSVLYAIGMVQGMDSSIPNIRSDSGHASVDILLTCSNSLESEKINHFSALFYKENADKKWQLQYENKDISQLPFENKEPNHLLVPFFSKRKTTHYSSREVKKEYTKQISIDWSNLVPHLAKIISPTFPQHKTYTEACESILGFIVSPVPSEHGQQAGIFLPSGEELFIEQMGAGVPHIVDLLIKLAVSKDKIFLIEEPENDLHPQALKALLALIIESSKHNQFIISTHSNIVVQHLCAEQDSRLFEVRVKDAKQQLSEISEVETTPEARLRVLEDLGYSLSDTAPYLWDAWLILEESSAETIIRNHLIPWFYPKLARLKTFSAQGTGNVEKAFSDLQRLITFAHLEPTYKNKTWVIVDGDESGQTAIKTIKEKFKDWDAEKFQTFSAENFETYYPERFAEKAKTALSAPDDANTKKNTAKRAAKAALLKEVIAWLAENPDKGKAELAKSAKEVIDKLKQIESTLA
ncbi:MAG: AAA family ATPase [Gallionella sp.]|nr:AAA family ATPase [Gallionella sp.]MDD4958832.1 AAA family ATPase [Gallionella sp.]